MADPRTNDDIYEDWLDFIKKRNANKQAAESQ